MRNLLHRFLDIRKLAAIILAAAIAAMAVVSLTSPPVRAGHDLPAIQQKIISFKVGCYTADSIIEFATAPTQELRQALWARALGSGECLESPFRFSAYFVAVVTKLQWLGGDRIVVLENHSPGGNVVFTWYTEKYWNALGIEPISQRI